jgi:cytoskeletal protein RodZ
MSRLVTEGPAEGPRVHAFNGDGDTTPLGEFLRRARERRGLTLEEISKATRIPSRHLSALEQGNLAAIPGGFYRRAEIRAYAEAVHLDPSVALARLERALAPEERRVPVPEAPVPPKTARHARIESVVAIGVVIAAFVFWLATWQRTNEPASTEAPASAPTAATGSTAPASSGSPAPSTVAEPVPAALESAIGDEPAAAPAETEAEQVTDVELIVVTEPEGARVTVDGIGWGVTPITIRHLAMGAKRVRVTKDGYAVEDRIVRLVGDRPSVSVRISLRSVQ